VAGMSRGNGLALRKSMFALVKLCLCELSHLQLRIDDKVTGTFVPENP